jgi:hypothetical protein
VDVWRDWEGKAEIAELCWGVAGEGGPDGVGMARWAVWVRAKMIAAVRAARGMGYGCIFLASVCTED